MVRKSYGPKRGTRQKLKLGRRQGITRFLREFKVDDKVNICIASSTNIPHPRYHGRLGKIASKRGHSYEVLVQDGKALKKLFIRPEHLKPVKEIKNESIG